jgi:hypothetical protein
MKGGGTHNITLPAESPHRRSYLKTAKSLFVAATSLRRPTQQMSDKWTVELRYRCRRMVVRTSSGKVRRLARRGGEGGREAI